MTKYVVLVGNPIDGIRIVGPFGGAVEANEWADSTIKNEDWWCVALVAPEDERS